MTLLWRLGALGDTVLLLPALAALRAAFPGQQIAVVATPGAAAPLLWSGLVDLLLDGGSARLAALTTGAAPPPGALPDGLTHAVVWSAHHVEVGRGLRKAGVATVVTAPLTSPQRLATARHYLETLRPLGVVPVPFTLRAPEEAARATEPLWRDRTDTAARVVLLHPGTGSVYKEWPLAHYRRLAARLRGEGLGVLWSVGPADAEQRAALLQSGDVGVLPLMALPELAAILARVAVVVSGDTGVAQLAALMGRPTVTLFGPTDPLRWSPPGPASTVVSLSLPCAPCDRLARSCPSRLCLRALPVSAVHASVHEMLAGRGVGDQRTAPNTAQPPDRSTGEGPDRDARGVPLPQAVFRCPPPSPTPGAVIQPARWDNGHRWGGR